ncbi:MAG: O-antigen ligase family protein [Candidatus Wildermuthbacteria bacterium]|nr:O-antigen ligase family protein [Candidatus Wildermuthbacteria bacterium]
MLGATSIFLINKYPDAMTKSDFLNKRPELQIAAQGIFSRFSFQLAKEDPRISAWRVSLQALKERPLLGYGPENFSIGFNKFFDPSLPNFETQDLSSPTNWWDRAHNIFLDIAIASGVPALLAFLSFFGALFIFLQKIKKSSPILALSAHTMQTTLLAYFMANLFSFDTFSTYLLLSLATSYSLFIIFEYKKLSAPQTMLPKSLIPSFWLFIQNKQIIIMLAIVFGSAFFVWKGAIKPILTTNQINLAYHEVTINRCDRALIRMASLAKTPKNFLSAYTGMKYAEMLKKCGEKNPKERVALAQRGIEITREVATLRPTHITNWLFLTGFANLVLEAGQTGKIPQTSIDATLKEAYGSLETARILSPKQQKTYVEWVKTDILSQNYSRAKAHAEECVAINQATGACWWFKGLAEIYLGRTEQGLTDIETAAQKGYYTQSLPSLQRLINVYIATQNYPILAATYLKLIELEPSNFQYHASLAMTYKEMGEPQKARAEALRALEINPTLSEEVREFLNEL